MRRLLSTARTILAVILWASALVVPAIFVGAWFDIALTRDLVELLQRSLGFALVVLASLFAICLLMYPPSVPFLKLAWLKTRHRLATDQKPYYDAVFRLRHLETHADQFTAGRTARQLGMLPQAVQHLSRAAELDPTHLGSRFELGMALAELNQPDAAAQVLQAVVQRDESHGYGAALATLARCRVQRSENEVARDLLLRHATLFPGDRTVLLLLARVHRALGDVKASRQALDAAATPPKDNERLRPEDEMARARARVARWRSGGVA